MDHQRLNQRAPAPSRHAALPDAGWQSGRAIYGPPCPRARYDNLDACHPGRGGYTALG